MICFHPLKCVVIVPKMKKFGGSFGNSIYETAGVFNGFIFLSFRSFIHTVLIL